MYYEYSTIITSDLICNNPPLTITGCSVWETLPIQYIATETLQNNKISKAHIIKTPEEDKEKIANGDIEALLGIKRRK